MEAMEHFVDAMDLMDAGEKDEDGNRLPWFDTRLSFNPAIHRTKQAQFHAAVVQDLNAYPLPSPHPELVKYFDPPRRVLKRAHDAIEECKHLFKVKEVPRRIARTRKDGHVRARDDAEETILLDKMPQRTRSQSVLQSVSSRQKNISSQKPQYESKKQRRDNSETESETEDEEMLLDKKQPLPTPDLELDSNPNRGRAPGRIVGTNDPLQDFKKNIARGDVVTKAVEDLAAVIREIVLTPSASRRAEELIQCMRELRQVAPRVKLLARSSSSMQQ